MSDTNRPQIARSDDSSLRDRIAKVLWKQFEAVDDNAVRWDELPDFRDLADAVIAELLPKRQGSWGWMDGTVSTNPKTGNPIKLEIEPGEVIPLSVEDARNVALALLAAVDELEGPTMSDPLRDRIAAALKAQAEFRGIYKIADFDFQFLADAVIEALNLDVAVTYLSVDKLRREFCVEGHYTVEVNDA